MSRRKAIARALAACVLVAFAAAAWFVWRGDQHVFKHALTHDVAYATLLAQRRTALHRVVAASVEELYADRLRDHYETLAHHYERGEQWDKAYEYLMAAGEKVRDAFANSDAVRYFTRAFEAAKHLRENSEIALSDAASGRAAIHSGIGEFASAIADFHLAGELAHAAGDRHRQRRSARQGRMEPGFRP